MLIYYILVLFAGLVGGFFLGRIPYKAKIAQIEQTLDNAQAYVSTEARDLAAKIRAHL